LESTIWPFFIKFIETEDEKILDEFVSQKIIFKEYRQALFDSLLYYCIVNEKVDVVESLLSDQYGYYPRLKYIFIAKKKCPNMLITMIDRGIEYRDVIVKGRQRREKISQLVSILCERNPGEFKSYVFSDNIGTNWLQAYNTESVGMLEFLMNAVPNFIVPPLALWSAMTTDNVIFVDVLTKHGGNSSWMEPTCELINSEAMPVVEKHLLDSNLAQGNEIISAYAGGHVFQYDLQPPLPKSTEKLSRSEFKSDFWDMEYVTITPTPSINLIKEKYAELKSGQTAWDIVLAKGVLKQNTGLSWMEPANEIKREVMEHVDFEMEENTVLMGYAGTY
jgi:hypothetical protein